MTPMPSSQRVLGRTLTEKLHAHANPEPVRNPPLEKIAKRQRWYHHRAENRPRGNSRRRKGRKQAIKVLMRKNGGGHIPEGGGLCR